MKYDFPMIVPTIACKCWLRLLAIFDLFVTNLLCWIWGVKRGRGSIFRGVPVIRTRHRKDILLGRNIVVLSRASSNLVGIMSRSIIDTRFGGKIQIGDGTGLSGTIISSRKKVKIGCNVKIGGNVRIFDHDFHSIDAEKRKSKDDAEFVRSSPVIIDDDVFIGTNAIVLKGTELGARTIVAAGSVVFGLKVPPDSMVKGNPAEIVR